MPGPAPPAGAHRRRHRAGSGGPRRARERAPARTYGRSCTPSGSSTAPRLSGDGFQEIGPEAPAHRRTGPDPPADPARARERARPEIAGERRFVGPLVDDGDPGIVLARRVDPE